MASLFCLLDRDLKGLSTKKYGFLFLRPLLFKQTHTDFKSVLRLIAVFANEICSVRRQSVKASKFFELLLYDNKYHD